MMRFYHSLRNIAHSVKIERIFSQHWQGQKKIKSLTHNSAPMFREIITNKGAIRTKYSQLKTLSENYIPKEDTDKLTFRFYLTANARDINESFYLYKKKLIELQHHADNGHEESWNKIKRLDKEWKSMLQKEGNKEDSYFIIDIDKSSLDTFESIYMGLQEETDIITSIKTPNGYHIITEPFNYPNSDIIYEEYIETKTDDLMFISMK